MKYLCLLAVLVLAFSGGCTVVPGKTEPKEITGKYDFGNAKKMILAQIKGEPDTIELFKEYFKDSMKKNNWWEYEDRLEQEIKIDPDANSVHIIGTTAKEDEAFLRIDLGTWKVSNLEDLSNKKENEAIYATVFNFTATCIGFNDVKFIDRANYSTAAIIDKSLGAAEKARAESLKKAVDFFIRDITPVIEKYDITIDDSKEDIKPIAKLASENKYSEAREKLFEILKADENRTDVLYNIAVTYHLENKYYLAIEYYDKALKLLTEENSRYEKAKSECVRNFLAKTLP